MPSHLHPEQGQSTRQPNSEYLRAALVFLIVSVATLPRPALLGEAVFDRPFAERFLPALGQVGQAGTPAARPTHPEIEMLARSTPNDPLLRYRSYFASAQSEDLDLFVWPDHAWERSQLRSGQMPQWRPDIMGGVPIRAVSLASPWSPLSWPAYILPLVQGRTLMILLHLWLAGFAFYAFLRDRGRRQASAWVGGLAYMLNPLSVTYLTYGDFVPVFALLPLNLMVVCRLIAAARPWRSGAALAALTGLLFLSGGSLYAGYAVMIQLGAAVAFSPPSSRARLRAVAVCGLATVVGLAAAGIELLPLLDLAAYSLRTPDKYAATNAMPVAGLLSWIFPHFFGHPGRGDFVGGFVFFRHFSGFYGLSPGTIVLGLAAAGAVSARARGAALVVLLLGGFLVLLGYAPAHALLVEMIPGLDGSHLLRLLIVGFLVQAYLAAQGVDAFLEGRLSRRPLWILAGLMLLAVVVMDVWSRVGASPASAMWLHVHYLARSGSVLLSPRVLFPFLLMAGLLALATVAARQRRMAPLVAWVLVAGVGLELVVLAWPSLPSAPADALARPTREADTLRDVVASRPGRVVGLTEADSFPPALGDHLPANTAAAMGFEDLRAFMRIPPASMTELLAVATRSGFHEFIAFRNVDLPVFDLLDVRYVLSSRVPGDPFRFRRLAPGVWENRHAVGRAFFTRCAQVVSDSSSRLARLLDPGFDPTAAAIVEQAIPGLPLCDRDAQAFAIPVARPDPEHVDMSVDAPSDGIVVLSESYFPGWRVVVDGIEQPVLRVDHALRGVLVPAGAHKISYRYVPDSFRRGVQLSLLAWLAILLTAFFRWPRKPPSDDTLLAGAALVLLLVFAGGAPMPNDNDALYAGVMRTLREGGSPFLLRIGGVPFLDKPPLFFYIGALMTAVVGEGLLVLRLFPILAGAAGVVLVARTTRRLSGSRAAAALAGLSLLAAPSYYEYSRRIYMEVPVAVLGFWAFDLGLRDKWKRAGVVAGLAFMFKSVVGLLGFASLGLVHLLNRRLPRGLVVSSLLALAVIVPWHVAAYLADPPTFMAFTVDLHLKHQIVEAQPWSRGGPLFYLAVLFSRDLVMGLFLVVGLCLGIRACGKERRFEIAALLLAIALQLVLYTVSATKKPFYLLTAYPFVAVLGGWAIAPWLEQKKERILLVGGLVAALFVFGCGDLVLPEVDDDQGTYIAPLAARMGELSAPGETLYAIDTYFAAAQFASRREAVFAVPGPGVRDMLMRIPYLRYGNKVIVWDSKLLRQGAWVIAPAPTAARLVASEPGTQVIARNQALWLLHGGQGHRP
jgi:hypothetical protein